MARGKLNRGTQSTRQVRVGIVIILGLLLLAYGIFQVGRLFDVFASRYPLFTRIENSAGLIEGAPVTLAGQRVGQIERIRFLPVDQRADSATILVRFSVNQAMREQIRADSRAALQTQGLLGDRYIDISPGSQRFPPLNPGDTIPSTPALDYEAVLQTAATTMDEVQQVVIGLSTITDRMAAGEGTLGALLVDDALYREMTAATAELGRLVGAVHDSDGTLARLIDDPTLYDRLDQTLIRLDSIGAAVLDQEGSLGRLIGDDALYEGLVGAVGRADSTLAALERMIGQAADADGTFARLLEDPELYDQLLKSVVDLQSLIQELREDPGALSPRIRVF